jgi:hypothetical protein
MINIFFGLPPINQPPILKSIFYPTIFISNSIYFQFVFTFFLSSLLYLRFKLIIENFKKRLFPKCSISN